MTIRELLTKINDVLRPAHVGSREPSDIATRGGNANSVPRLVQSQQDKRPS